jgi:hypothetical protein
VPERANRPAARAKGTEREADTPPAANGTERAAAALAANTSRRGFLARVSGGLMAAAGAGAVVRALVQPGEADAYHFCGHIFTTGSCLHPTGTPRIDSRGLPLDARTGRPVDNLGRRIDSSGHAVTADGELLRDPDGRPLPPAPRTGVCQETARQHNFRPFIDGGWYRCCGGYVRKLADCCGYSDTRINGDAALTGYCYGGRKVFCVMYYQTRVPC